MALLSPHETVQSDENVLKCPDCLKLFKSKSSLQRHRTHNHKGIRNYVCEECNASFAQQTNLWIHMQRLHPRKFTFSHRYQCSKCSCIFTRLNSLNRHMTARHNIDAAEVAKNDASDPNQLAKLVVAQLKSLENEMSCYSIPNTTIAASAEPPKIDSPTLDESIYEDSAKIDKRTIVNRLFPQGNVTTMAVQTVKRPRQKLSYVCEYCALEFKKSYNLIRHLRTHPEYPRPYNCPNCSKCFGTKSQLQAHSERMHILDETTGMISNAYRCCICAMTFDSLLQLDMHMTSHDQSVQYECKNCSSIFKTITAFASHRHHTSDESLEMLENLIPEPIMLNVPVTDCPKMNTSKIKRIHFSCNLCGLLLESEAALKKHTKHHQMIKKFKCPICSRSYSNQFAFQVHKKSHEKVERLLIPCNKCEGKSFLTKSQLKRHDLHVHQNIRNVRCVYCEKTFKSKAYCKIHMKNHLNDLLKTDESGETSTTSPLKGKAFIQTLDGGRTTAQFVEIEMLSKLSKNKHKNIQIIEKTDKQPPPEEELKVKKSHVCSNCEKEFHKPCDLVRHMRTHTDVRLFECDTCQKSFKLEGTLREHLKTHQKESERIKHTCQVCGKSYASSKSLNIHLRLHTGNLPFKCDYCGKSFRTSGHRLSHMRSIKAENGKCKGSQDILYIS